MGMLDKLERYYADNGILATRFTCSHRDECCGGLKRRTSSKSCFTGPKSAYVGECYERAHGFGLPRLLFVSLDSGSAESEPTNRLPQSVRQQTIEGSLGPKNRHWYRTHELAACIFNRILETCMTPCQAQPYFAHANAAKCCQNKPGRRQADKRLFDNCRQYLRGELELLCPDVVVSQGNPAETGVARMVGDQPPPRSWPTKRVHLGDREVFWLHTYHPAAFGRFNSQRRDRWAEFADEVKAFFDDIR